MKTNILNQNGVEAIKNDGKELIKQDLENLRDELSNVEHSYTQDILHSIIKDYEKILKIKGLGE